MPDLTIHAVWTCATNTDWSVKVAGSKGKTYEVCWTRLGPGATTQYGWECSCSGFKYRKQCKHVRLVTPQRCGWNSALEVGTECDRDAKGDPCCPVCSGPVVAYNVGV